MPFLTLKESFEAFSGALPSVTAEEVELYESHFRLLQHWNEKINLVSRRSIEQSFAAHYTDSLWISHHAHRFAGKLPVYDIGTGAGFPGMLFAIRYPKISITLFEKSLKKQTFLSAAREQLALSNISLEGSAPPRLGPGLFLCRAVFPQEKFFEFFKKTAAVGSVIAWNLGGQRETEVLPKPFAKVEEIRYSLPAGAGDRRLLIVRIVPRGT